jgi:hypothetical protein
VRTERLVEVLKAVQPLADRGRGGAAPAADVQPVETTT